MKRAAGVILIIIGLLGSCSASFKPLNERQAKGAKGPLTDHELGQLIGTSAFGIVLCGLGVWLFVVGGREEDQTRRRELDAALQSDKEKEAMKRPNNKTAGGAAGEPQEAITPAGAAQAPRLQERNKVCSNCGQTLSIYAVKCRYCKKEYE